MKNIVICDIDGVLLDPTARLPYLIAGDFATYQTLWQTDVTLAAGHAIYSSLASMWCRLVFVTSRVEACRVYTLTQLRTLFPCMEIVLLMRPNNCKEHDIELKPRLFKEAGYSLDDVLVAFDDRDSMVARWRELGVTCYQSQRAEW